jgi:hypothetical protein
MIYKLCLIRGYTEAYYQLSEEERDAFWKQVGENLEKTGARLTTPQYDCRWSNDKYGSFFIMEYPNIEAAIADSEGVESFNFFRYLISETIFGVARTD